MNEIKFYSFTNMQFKVLFSAEMIITNENNDCGYGIISSIYFVRIKFRTSNLDQFMYI